MQAELAHHAQLPVCEANIDILVEVFVILCLIIRKNRLLYKYMEGFLWQTKEKKLLKMYEKKLIQSSLY